MSFQSSKSDNTPLVVLTIAGFDPSSGAGVTADLQVFAAHGLFGVSAITALTVQSTLGVAANEPVAPAMLRHTLEHLAADFKIAGVKIGMLGSSANVSAVAAFLKAKTIGGVAGLPIVLDPVLRSSSGAELLGSHGLSALRSELLDCVSWVTPNWVELSALAGMPVANTVDAEGALQSLSSSFPHLHLVATGGDCAAEPNDLWLAPRGSVEELCGHRIDTTSTHGTGCAYSSALLSRLVLGHPARDAVGEAKAYVEGALQRAPGLGHGRGPLDLLWPIRPQA